MKFKLRAVSEVLIGLHRVGLIGLEAAFRRADESGLSDRDALVELLMAALAPQNYIPAAAQEEYRQAVWREYQRHRGEDIRDLYSEIAVVVRGQPGAELDRFVARLAAVLGEHELRPATRFEPPDAEGPNPQLLIAGQTVLAGTTGAAAMRRAVRAQISDW